MKTVQKEALVSYSAEQMFELVNDIAAYPEFLPWCEQSTIISQTADEVVASLHLGWKGIHKTFTTANHLRKNESMTMKLVDGPFKHLEGVWQFKQLGDLGSKISVSLEFEFKSDMLGLAFSKVFEHIANTLVDSFIQRANELYG